MGISDAIFCFTTDARHYHVTLIYHTVGGERTQDEIFAKETLSESLEKDYNYKVCNISDIPAGESMLDFFCTD